MEKDMTDQQQEWLDFAKSVAHEAGDIMRKYFGKKLDAHFKADNTIVTVADEEINQLVIQRVAERYPDHDIDGEEASDRRGSDYVWACDPIDGTAPFAMELPVSVFSLALVVDGQPEVGVIYAPFSDHLYWAVCGQGAFMNGKQIYVNKKTFGGMTGMNVDWWPNAQWDVMRVIHKLAYEKGAYVTAPGSTTHAAALVARGEFVASVFAGTKGKNVDVAAAKVIVEEAGGKVTDLFGREQRYDQDICGAVLSNGIVHEEIVEAMRKL
jgi:inositol-phosphate phosphatase